MDSEPGEPDDDLAGAIDSVASEVWAADPRARLQDMTNSAAAFLAEALREEGRESEALSPQEFAEETRALLDDPEFAAGLAEQMGPAAVDEMRARMSDPLYGADDGDSAP